MERGLLLVDDELNVLKSLKRSLEDEKYTIYTATSGKEALALLATTPVQVIISDQRMPNMTGTEFLTEVKKLYPHTIRIILSAYSDFDALKDAINQGAIYKFISKPWEADAICGLVRDSFQLNMGGAKQEKLLEKNYDSLTGLPNRILFNKYLEEVMVSSRITYQSLAIVLVYLDGFNRVDDPLGEVKGDKVLKLIANRLKEWVGSEKNIVSIGRGKFCLMLKDILPHTLDNQLRDLLAEINKPINLAKTRFFLSSTIGVSIFPDHGNTYSTLLQHAQYAREHCTKLGSNFYQIYSPWIESKNNELINETDILNGLERGEFLVYYQPIVSASTYNLVGAEALIRWEHPQLGFLSPDNFIPLCEETGLIVQLGAFILQKACQQLRKWHKENSNLFISVNISPRQLRDTKFLDLIKDTLASTQILPDRLELELTENIMMYDIGYHIDIMQKISALSVKISIDDFGTGFSSLNYLKLLPISKLKIDKTFVMDIATSIKSKDIIDTIIALAKISGLILVAEGVETPEQLKFLEQRKCEQIQGYIFSKPITATEFELLIAKTKMDPY